MIDSIHNRMDFKGYHDSYEKFDVKAYLVSRYSTAISEAMAPWNIQCYHKFYESYKGEWDNSNAVLLQLGAGPCIYDLISAAPYVTEIYHSDYLKECCDEVLLWKNKDPSAFDWSPYFQFIVNTLEGKAGQQAVLERENTLRGVLKDSFTCDVQQSPIHTPAFLKAPDIICISFCIEFASPSAEKYTAIMKEVFGMLKPKGFLAMVCSLGCTWYMINGVKFPGGCTLSEKFVEDTLKGVGFVVHFKESRDKLAPDEYNDATGQAFFIAQKPSD